MTAEHVFQECVYQAAWSVFGLSEYSHVLLGIALGMFKAPG